MHNNSTPKIFLRMAISTILLKIEKIPALIQPNIIAGIVDLISRLPCRQRNSVVMMAQGMKNNRLMLLAMFCSKFSTNVSHRIKRLPPPTPNPERKPSAIERINTNGKLSSINSEHLPTELKDQEFYEAMLLVFFCRRDRQECHPAHYQLNRGVLCAKVRRWA